MSTKTKDIKIKERNYNLLILTIFFCTILIILSNYVFTKNVVVEVNRMNIENEYKKIWGKDNYKILREIQKEEMLSYLNKLKQEKPEYIDTLMKKAEMEEKLESLWSKTFKKVSPEVLEKLKENTYIKWSPWALVTILEFSDLECPYCKTFHNNNAIENTLVKYEKDVNYWFKHLPLPKHENAKKEAEAVKCVENLWEEWKSLEYIDSIFIETKSWGTWYDLDNLAEAASEVGVDKEEFINCYNNGTYKDLVNKEFNEGIGLWINSTPSSVIINNETWEYVILPWVITEEKLEETINMFILK